MTLYKMTIAYDGTDFGGWQVQPNALTIQELIEEKLSLVLQQKIEITGAGRTDAGVHALGQVAHFEAAEPIATKKLFLSLNALLPPSVQILSLEEAPVGFHARYSAKKKIYRYHLTLSTVQNPLDRFYKLHVKHPVDVARMMEGAKHLLGEHNFSAFANEQNFGAAGKNPVRHLYRLEFIPDSAGGYLEFEGNSFLYKMVRNIVGTLLELGGGKREPADIKAILTSQDRRLAGKAAPPHGLFLVQIDY